MNYISWGQSFFVIILDILFKISSFWIVSLAFTKKKKISSSFQFFLLNSNNYTRSCLSMNVLSQLIHTRSMSNLGISIPFFQKYQQQYSIIKIFMDLSVGKAAWVSLCEYTRPWPYFPIYLSIHYEYRVNRFIFVSY